MTKLRVAFRKFAKATKKRQETYIQPNKYPLFTNNTKLKDPVNVADIFKNLFLSY
jgi:hypothetical protein